MTGVSALITCEYGISFTQWIQLHPMIPTHNNILYSFHQSNTNMFTQRVNSLMHNVALCTTPQDSNYQTLWPTMWVELKKGHTRKKGSELLQASRKVRPIQHICKSTTNYFIPHHTERSSKRGGGERRRGYLPVFCRPLRCRIRGFVWMLPRPEWRWPEVQQLSFQPGWGGRGRWHQSGGDPTQSHQPPLNRCLRACECVKVLYS